MPRIVERTVLFADLRGSTGLYELLGNAEATALITRAVARLGDAVERNAGRVVKTLGDGLMALFERPADAMGAALAMHEEIDQQTSFAPLTPPTPEMPPSLRVQAALACGEVVEMNGDCFGDAVNVAARLLEHAGDGETLVTGEVHARLGVRDARRFRSLDRMHLRGRVEPVRVHALGRRRAPDTAVTQFGGVGLADEPRGVRLVWRLRDEVFDGGSMPLVLGRSPQAHFRVDNSRVSRSHARIDWHAGFFHLSDLSYNGTYVRFAEGSDVLTLRRARCALHGRGTIGLGGSPDDPTAPCVRFEVLSASDPLDTQPGDFVVAPD